MTSDFLDLHELADLDVSRTPPVEQIHQRARTIQRRRRMGRGAVVGALAVGLVVGGVTIPLGSGGLGRQEASYLYLGAAPASAADGSGGDCSMGFGSWIERDAWAGEPDVVAAATLFGGAADVAPLRGIGVHQNEGQCPPATPAALLYSDAPVRGVSVWPDVANPYRGDVGLVDQEVRGTTGRLFRLDADSRVISWAEPDGRRWLAEGSGTSEAEFVAILDGLVFVDDQVVPTSVPAGFRSAPLPTPTTERTTRSWEAQYGSPGAEWTDDRVLLFVGSSGESPAVNAARYAAGVTFTTVGGELAAYVAAGDGGGTLAWQSEGLSYRVTAAKGDAVRLVALAENLEHVSIDDARVRAAKDVRDVPDRGR